MNHIVLTPEQFESLQRTGGAVEVRDPTGRPLGRLTPFTAEASQLDGDSLVRTADGQVMSLSQWEKEALEKIKQRKNEPREPGIPSATVVKHLQRLDEIDQQERLTPERTRELLRRMQAGEEV